MPNRPNSPHLRTLCLLALAFGACGGDSPTDVRSSPASLSTLCLTAGTQVSCTASFFSGGTSGRQADVTADATWLASDPAVGVFVRPGVLSPAKRGEVGISASYRGVQTRVSSRFLVDPVQPPRRLETLSGNISDDLSGDPLSGATVEILSGYSQGVRVTTNQYGFYLVDTMLAGETFTARASSSGYAPVLASYRVDSSVVFPGDPSNPPYLPFRLHKVE